MLHINDSAVSDTDIKCIIEECKALRMLNVLKTKVTRIGVLDALNNLPALKELRHEDIVDALYHSERNSLDVPIIEYSLSTITILYDSSIYMGSLSKAVALCPSLTQVEIKAPESFKDDYLLELLELKHLRRLQISAILTNNLSFNEGVASLFRHTFIGNSLESIALSHFREVQIGLITECCPNLRYLELHRNVLCCFKEPLNEEYLPEVERSMKTPPKPPSKLEILNLNSCDCCGNLVFLLSSPALMYITLSNCIGLTDHMFQKIAKVNVFPHLRYLEVNLNSRLTKVGIDTLMKKSNPLKAIKLRGCTKVTENDLEVWQQLICKENWNLSITKEEP